MTDWLDRVDVVLARPAGALNVGACCRAMKSMGLKSLILAAPEDMRRDEVFTMALHARDVYENAQVYDNLESALAGTVLSAGITRRRGARRKWFSLLPEELAERAASAVLADSAGAGRVAVVFGSERDGLSDEELACCNLACHIPSSPDFPSLNLSHAVQLTASAFWRRSINGRSGAGRPGRSDPAAEAGKAGAREAGVGEAGSGDRKSGSSESGNEIEVDGSGGGGGNEVGGESDEGFHSLDRDQVDNLTAVIHSSLEAMNYFKSADPLYTDRFFRDILARAALSVREARHMEKIFRKLQYLKAERTDKGRAGGS